MSEQNKIQIGGDHYKTGGEEHWDRVFRLRLDYFQAAITKYVERCWKKNGVQDLEKARHFLDKYIELHTAPKVVEPFFQANSTWVRLGDVVPTGWRGFTFEGADAGGYLYTCRDCRAAFRAPPDDNPHAYHTCPAEGEPGSGYVDQG